MTWLCNTTQRRTLIAGIVWHAATHLPPPIILSESSLVAAREGTFSGQSRLGFLLARRQFQSSALVFR